jgi:hypothetical protein
MTQRLHEMNPNAPDYTSIFNRVVPFNSMQYIYFDQSANDFVIAPTLPQFGVDPRGYTTQVPDGQTLAPPPTTYDPYNILIDVDQDGGYPHPFDCPPQDQGQPNLTTFNKVEWTKSSGFLNLLGYLKLRNCVQGGTAWCCPC